jgi:hypothetical protein
MLQGSVLFDVLSSALKKKKKKERKRGKWPGGFFPGQTHPAVIAIKSCLSVSP